MVSGEWIKPHKIHSHKPAAWWPFCARAITWSLHQWRMMPWRSYSVGRWKIDFKIQEWYFLHTTSILNQGWWIGFDFGPFDFAFLKTLAPHSCGARAKASCKVRIKCSLHWQKLRVPRFPLQGASWSSCSSHLVAAQPTNHLLVNQKKTFRKARMSKDMKICSIGSRQMQCRLCPVVRVQHPRPPSSRGRYHMRSPSQPSSNYDL